MRTLFVLLLLLLSSNSYAQLETGLLLNGGIGSISNTSLRKDDMVIDQFLESGGRYKVKNLFNIAAGYRLRFNDKKINSFFYDIDFMFGVKKMEYKTLYCPNSALLESKASDVILPLSIGIGANYKVMNDFYVGIGITPTYYFATPKTMYDIPIKGMIGYTTKKIGFSLNYQYSLVNTLKTKVYDGGRFSDWSVTIYIPFSLRKKQSL